MSSLRRNILGLGCGSATVFFSGCSIGDVSHAACGPEVQVSTASHTLVRIDPSRAQRSGWGKSFFGFNQEWTGFQDSFWTTKGVSANLVGKLEELPSAVYRYPGGTVSNYFDWQVAVGPPQSRSARMAVPWRGPITAQYGVDEYFAFVDQVGGKPWLVANLFGDYGRERPVEEMVARNIAWARYVDMRHDGVSPVLRWELGNELDRDIYKWPPEKYASVATKVSRGILTVQPKAKFVALLEDYDAYAGMTASEYNRKVVSLLPSDINEFALHSYYDGKPGGPPVQNRLNHICRVINDVKSVRPTVTPGVWITEHGRWPAGKPADPNWKAQWWKTTNLEGALAVADFMIGLAQIPEVQGAFNHSLAGTEGPWPLFKRRKSDGLIYPSAIYWTFHMLQGNMLPRVLSTQVMSTNYSGYAGGYDIRAVSMSDHAGERRVIWAVNRNRAESSVRLQIPGLSKTKATVQHTYLSNVDINAANDDVAPDRLVPRTTSFTLTFDPAGVGTVVLPPNSVSVLAF